MRARAVAAGRCLSQQIRGRYFPPSVPIQSTLPRGGIQHEMQRTGVMWSAREDPADSAEFSVPVRRRRRHDRPLREQSEMHKDPQRRQRRRRSTEHEVRKFTGEDYMSPSLAPPMADEDAPQDPDQVVDMPTPGSLREAEESRKAHRMEVWSRICDRVANQDASSASDEPTTCPPTSVSVADIHVEQLLASGSALCHTRKPAEVVSSPDGQWTVVSCYSRRPLTREAVAAALRTDYYRVLMDDSPPVVRAFSASTTRLLCVYGMRAARIAEMLRHIEVHTGWSATLSRPPPLPTAYRVISVVNVSAPAGVCAASVRQAVLTNTQHVNRAYGLVPPSGSAGALAMGRKLDGVEAATAILQLLQSDAGKISPVLRLHPTTWTVRQLRGLARCPGAAALQSLFAADFDAEEACARMQSDRHPSLQTCARGIAAAVWNATAAARASAGPIDRPMPGDAVMDGCGRVSICMDEREAGVVVMPTLGQAAAEQVTPAHDSAREAASSTLMDVAGMRYPLLSVPPLCPLQQARYRQLVRAPLTCNAVDLGDSGRQSLVSGPQLWKMQEQRGGVCGTAERITSRHLRSDLDSGRQFVLDCTVAADCDFSEVLRPLEKLGG